MSISEIKSQTINKIALMMNDASSEATESSTSFKEVLKNISPNIGGLSSGDPANPSKAQLIESLMNLQIQMNRRLMNAMSAEAKDDVESGYTLRLNGLLRSSVKPSDKQNANENMTLEGINSSNNLQANQNNDVFTVRKDLDLIIDQAAEAHGVEPALIKSVIKVESNFNPKSTSPKGAMGLMQLMPATAKNLGVRNAYDPAENVQAGTRYLKTLLDRYDGNVDMALAAYNWGMGNLEKKQGKMPEETKNYIKNVTRHYERAKV